MFYNEAMPKSRKRLVFAIVIAGVLLAAGLLLASHSARRSVRIGFETALAHAYAAPDEPYPSIDTRNLTDTQQKIIALTSQEYAKKPVSFDARVMAYSQGAKEPWCANFVSWIMHEAGVPFHNPAAGSWRIAGVGVLQDYYKQKDAYEEAGSYRPKVGDVAIFRHNRSHANIVIAVQGDTMTTIGGNETGHLRIHTQPFSKHSEGLSGFGVLNK